MADRNRLSVPQIRIIIDDVEPQRSNSDENDHHDDYDDSHCRQRTIKCLGYNYDNRDYDRQYHDDNYEDEDKINAVDTGQRFAITPSIYLYVDLVKLLSCGF